MFIAHPRKRAPFSASVPGRIRRNDRRAAIARKAAFLLDGLTVQETSH